MSSIEFITPFLVEVNKVVPTPCSEFYVSVNARLSSPDSKRCFRNLYVGCFHTASCNFSYETCFPLGRVGSGAHLQTSSMLRPRLLNGMCQFVCKKHDALRCRWKVSTWSEVYLVADCERRGTQQPSDSARQRICVNSNIGEVSPEYRLNNCPYVRSDLFSSRKNMQNVRQIRVNRCRRTRRASIVFPQSFPLQF